MKAFTYVQSTGAFGVQNGDFHFPLGSGYAGKGVDRNVPNSDHIKSKGPLPRGKYSVAVKQHARFAAPAIVLEQIEGDTRRRSGFWIHGDNSKGDQSASSGCIVLTAPVRRMIAAFIQDYGVDTLIVRP